MSKSDIEIVEEEFEHYNFIVDPKQQLLRIDKFLIDRLPNTTRSKIQSATKAGNIKVNGEVVKSNYKVRPADEISIVLSYPKEDIELIAEDIPLNIVYEDDDLMIVNKDAGMVVHPGYGNRQGTMVNALIHHFKSLPLRDGDSHRPGIVHRLDKNTSGILVVGKTDHALAHLSRQFFDRTSDRRYYALAWGHLDDEEGTIEGHIGRSLKNRKVMSVFPDGEFGKEAVTHYKVLKRFDYVTLVECKLDTGRTHQIRAHFRHIGHPLFGDTEYGGDRILKGTTFTKYKQFVDNCFKIMPYQALHAKTLVIDHPTTGERMSFSSEVSTAFEGLLEKWENYIAHRKD
jgi:23S rRNA pseudouridine1911/1915/1917 synthase